MAQKTASTRPHSLTWLSIAVGRIDTSETPKENEGVEYISLGTAPDAVRRLYALWESLNFDAAKAAASIKRAMAHSSGYRPSDVPSRLVQRCNRANHRKLLVEVLLLEELQMTYPESAHRFSHGSSVPSFFNGWTIGLETQSQSEECQDA